MILAIAGQCLTLRDKIRPVFFFFSSLSLPDVPLEFFFLRLPSTLLTLSDFIMSIAVLPRT